jgi:CheY-like chemotaxis protein
MKEEYLECGFDDYLSKPIEKTELERVINKFIKNVTKVAAEEAPEVTSIIKLEQEEKEIEYPDYKDKKVIVVDDSDIDFKLISKIIANYNFDITQCRSGSECIMKTIEEKYDVILLDEMMPNLSGLDTMENLKSIENFKTPVILLTNKKDEQRIRNNNFVHFARCWRH